MFQDFLSLIFPENCISCSRPLYKKEQCICIHCLYKFPKTFYHLESDNHLARRFWGRVEIFRAAAFLHFTKGSSVQRAMFKIKYHGMKEGAGFLGRQYGEELKKFEWDSFVDVIIPVPMHPKKLKKRGYNPSALFSEGLSVKLEKELCEQGLIRKELAVSQTGKSRFDRWENVKSIYVLNEEEKEKVAGKNVLLTDDVITTGATIESCAASLLNGGAKRVSVAAIAVAN